MLQNMPRPLRLRLLETLRSYGAGFTLQQHANLILNELARVEWDFWQTLRSMPVLMGEIGTVTEFVRESDGWQFQFVCVGNDHRQAAMNLQAVSLTDGGVARVHANERYLYVEAPSGIRHVIEIDGFKTRTLT